MNDNYSAPIPEAHEKACRDKAEALSQRLQIHLKGKFDSICLNGLADELDGLADEFRLIASDANYEHWKENNPNPPPPTGRGDC